MRPGEIRTDLHLAVEPRVALPVVGELGDCGVPEGVRVHLPVGGAPRHLHLVQQRAGEGVQLVIHSAVQPHAARSEAGGVPLPEHGELRVQLLPLVLEEVGDGGIVDPLHLQGEEAPLEERRIHGKEPVVELGIPVEAGRLESLPRLALVRR
jgi:hypothetical protein